MCECFNSTWYFYVWIGTKTWYVWVQLQTLKYAYLGFLSSVLGHSKTDMTWLGHIWKLVMSMLPTPLVLVHDNRPSFLRFHSLLPPPFSSLPHNLCWTSLSNILQLICTVRNILPQLPLITHVLPNFSCNTPCASHNFVINVAIS